MILDILCEPCGRGAGPHPVWSIPSTIFHDVAKLCKQDAGHHKVRLSYSHYKRGWEVFCACERHSTVVHTTISDDLVCTLKPDTHLDIIIKAAPEPAQPETKPMTIDNVTLLQIEKGVLIVEGRYLNDNGRNSTAKPYSFKIFEADYRRGAICLAGRSGEGGGYALIEIGDDISGEFEPQPGVNYVWAVPIDTSRLDQLMKTDKDARKTIRLGAAIAEAKAGLGALADTVALLPAVKVEKAD